MSRVVVCVCLIATGCATDPCDDLQAALDEAGAGDTVELGACTVSGTFTIPAGVVLAGEGGAVVRGSIAMADASSLRSVRVESSTIGIEAGAAAIEGVTVVAERGIGVRVRGASALAGVEISGPVTAENADSVRPMPSASETATHGLVIESAEVTLDDVVVRGFAGFGAVLSASTVVWTGGGAIGNLGTGLFVSGGSAMLTDVEIAGTLSGVQPLPAYGAVFTGGAAIASDGLSVHDNEAYGILQNASTSTHAGLAAESNRDVALWVQASDGFELSGSSRVAGNRIAGLVLVNASNVTVRDAAIDMTEEGTRIDGEVGTVEVGDGILAVLPSTDTLRVENVTLTGNGRAGVLIDVPVGPIAGGVFSGVTVDASGAAFGAIAQSPAGPIAGGAWDTGITRRGAAAANDAALTGRLDIVGIVGPMFLPDP
jgi:hypothetical protein